MQHSNSSSNLASALALAVGATARPQPPSWPTRDMQNPRGRWAECGKCGGWKWKSKWKRRTDSRAASDISVSAAEYAWPRRSSLTRSPDTLSPVYPDRPIRPLPKNRLKSRLSPEQSATLIYPPDPPISSLSFAAYSFSGSEKDHGGEMNGRAYEEKVICTCGGDHGEESDEEEVAYDHPSYHRGHSPSESLQQRRMLDGQRAAGKPPPPASTASSADGYESFENTSNKKKRKIPLSGSSGVHQSSLTAELANMGISSHGADGANDDAPPYSQNSYPSPSTGMGHAGAGRGRTSKASPIRRRDMRSSISSPHANGYPATVEQTVERGGAYKGDGTKISKTNEALSHARHNLIRSQLTNINRNNNHISRNSRCMNTK